MVYLRELRQLFYLALPWETMWETTDDVPNMVDEVIPWTNAIMVLEFLYLWKTGRKRLYGLNDSLTSIGSFLLASIIKYCNSAQLVYGIFTLSLRPVLVHIDFSLFCYIHKHYAVIDLPWNSAWTWLASFLAVDFSYYWLHRACHEVNVFWSMHQIHHSSQHYNLSTSVRNGLFQPFVTFVFYLPMAFFIPPQVHLVHLAMSILYQFWIHTQALPKLPILEYIFNTPSHHRVHHGRNRYCINKNYGATLIIWDRIFGTFQTEKDEEPVAYGLVHNIKTFDSMYLQLFHFKYSLWDKPRSVKGFTNKLKAIFYGPSWLPGTGRTGNLEAVPEIESNIVIYDVPSPAWVQLYLLLNMYLLLLTIRLYDRQLKTISLFNSILYTIWITFCVHVAAAICERSRYFQYLELFRLGLLSHVIGENVLWSHEDQTTNVVLKTITFASELIWIIYALKLAREGNAKKVR